MKTILMISVSMILFFGCEKDSVILDNDCNKQHYGAKLKAMYIYNSSTSDEPYSFTTYTYDDNWNLKKELLSEYPSPVFASVIYDYSIDGKLKNKKRLAIEGAYNPNQNESDFVLIWENKYEYIDNKTIEKVFRNNELTDSNVYSYNGCLLIEEFHNNFSNLGEWSIIYEYDLNNNLTKETSFPDGNYLRYFYEDSKLVKLVSYNKGNSILNETNYIYIKANDKSYTEIRTGEFLSEKITTENGKLIEHIKYHPTFPGSEWWCHRYDYY